MVTLIVSYFIMSMSIIKEHLITLIILFYANYYFLQKKMFILQKKRSFNNICFVSLIVEVVQFVATSSIVVCLFIFDFIPYLYTGIVLVQNESRHSVEAMNTDNTDSICIR